MTAAIRDATRASLPFDVHRSGIVSGEGSAALVLESAQHACARGARILAGIAGFASLADSHHASTPNPDGIWEARAMQLALDDAEASVDDVGGLIAHATATPKGDTAEINAINTVCRGRREALPATSLKGHLGHTGAASGAMSVIAAGHAMRTGSFPNTAGTRDVDPAAEFDVVTERPIDLDAELVQINAFGFGGQNTSLVLGRHGG